MTRRALVLGITGQDGSYLAEILLEKGWEVHGLVRRSATGNTRYIDHLLDRVTLHRGDLTDDTSILRTLQAARPEVVFNEADQDHVGWSYAGVGYSMDVTGAAVGRILELLRQIGPEIRFFQPCSSTMFGLADNPQTEDTPFRPQSPYGCAKVLAFHLARYYRDVFGMHVSTAILYNHESPRRTSDSVIRKITCAAARISRGLEKELRLGDVSAQIDVGFAREYMEAAYDIAMLERPDDFILCTGEAHSLREVLTLAFGHVGLVPDDHVRFDPEQIRPGKTSPLVGDSEKARRAIGFAPRVRLPELVALMMEHALREVEASLGAAPRPPGR